MKMKRNGFTLIELMIVVAIIIILVSIAVPVYAKLVQRARRARVISDFRTIRDSLEAYRTDWGTYPVTGTQGETFGLHTDFNAPTSEITKELTGNGATLNVSSNITATGEQGGIDYFTREWIIRKMYNPFEPTKDYEYYSSDGSSFELACEYVKSGGTVYLLSSDTFNYRDSNIKPVWYIDQ
jgi:type IV pilus assembly protein PilA